MITITGLSKTYGSRVLFENISLGINRQEKIGLIGPNGAGKSTFFYLLLGEVEPSSGSVKVNKNTRIGYLPQESSFKSSRTVLSELVEGEETIMRLKNEKAELESANLAGSMRYGEILHQLETLGYFELEYKAKKILAGLGFKQRDFDRPISQLSGGWQMRTLLAKLLVHAYDILLLDEPTNYLDLDAALWLKDFLAAFKGTFIMISHDKAFLTEVTNYTLIMENGSIAKVYGNYEQYERIKQEKRTYLVKQYNEQEKKRKQLERFVARFHAQPNKASQVRAKRRFLEKMEEVVLPPDPRDSIRDFRFPPAKRSGHQVIRLEGITKSYADVQVYRDFDFEVFRGEKAVLAGENGAGKSTLLKIIAGVIDIDAGTSTLGHNVDIGYFSQTRMDVLNLENTVLREAYSAAPGFMSEETIRTILGAFLFTGDDSDKPVKVLSGGEKSRLILAKLLINPPNFLLLDEPTTHLDVDAVDALVKALSEYEGTLVFISHDIYFVRSVANSVFEVKNGSVRKFPGNFDYYLAKKASGELPPPEHRPRIKNKACGQEAQLKVKQEDALRRQAQARRKDHNLNLRSRIDRLAKEKEKLRLETYAKTRALSNPHVHRDDQTIENYRRRLEEIEQRISRINEEIKRIKVKRI